MSARVPERQRRTYRSGFTDDDEGTRARIPPEFAVAPPPFRVTTECSDDESSDPLVLDPGFRRRTPNLIGLLPFENDRAGEEEPGQLYDPIFDNFRRTYQRSMSLTEAADMSQLATQEAVRAVGGELMAPHANFHIEKGKSKCTIRFDPPVSGRFILLKMWNPHNDPAANIDIQGVVAKGFAGPRYIPSVELR